MLADKRMNRSLLTAIVLMLLLGGCSGKKVPEKPPLTDEQFVEYTVQSAIIEREEKLAGQDSLAIRHRLDSLRAAQHIREVDVDKTVEFYHHNLDRWESVTSRVIKRLEELQKKGG